MVDSGPPKTCHARGLVDGPATQAMIAVVHNRDLSLGDGLFWFVKCDLHGVAGPALAHHDGNGSHAMADLRARPKAPMRKGGGWK